MDIQKGLGNTFLKITIKSTPDTDWREGILQLWYTGLVSTSGVLYKKSTLDNNWTLFMQHFFV